MRRKLLISFVLAVVTIGLVAWGPAEHARVAVLSRSASPRLSLRAQDVTPTPDQGVPTAEPTPVTQDTTQSLAALVLIWAVIIIVVIVTLFLIWWTRPGRKAQREAANKGARPGQRD